MISPAILNNLVGAQLRKPSGSVDTRYTMITSIRDANSNDLVYNQGQKTGPGGKVACLDIEFCDANEVFDSFNYPHGNPYGTGLGFLTLVKVPLGNGSSVYAARMKSFNYDDLKCPDSSVSYPSDYIALYANYHLFLIKLAHITYHN